MYNGPRVAQAYNLGIPKCPNAKCQVPKEWQVKCRSATTKVAWVRDTLGLTQHTTQGAASIT